MYMYNELPIMEYQTKPHTTVILLCTYHDFRLNVIVFHTAPCCKHKLSPNWLVSHYISSQTSLLIYFCQVVSNHIFCSIYTVCSINCIFILEPFSYFQSLFYCKLHKHVRLIFFQHCRNNVWLTGG